MMNCFNAICPAAECEALLDFSSWGWKEGTVKKKKKAEEEKLLQTALNSVEGQIYFRHTSLLLASNMGVKLTFTGSFTDC